MKVDDELLAVRAAELYYEAGKTQDEIGAMLHLTRWKVGRLLQQAREEGVIRIEIVHPKARRLPLERMLRDRFGLDDAIVVPAEEPVGEAELRRRVAAGASDYLTALRPVPRLLGVSWGRTLHDVAEALPQGWARGVDVVQSNGGVSLSRRASSAANTAVTIAQRAGGQTTLLPSPAILEQAETRKAIERDRIVAGVLELARSADAQIFSAGAVDGSSVLVESGYLTIDDARALVARGAIGDVLGRFVDADGNVVDAELDDRTVGITIDELRAAQHTIAIVAGAAKHDIARMLVTSGLCTVLVTDERTATALLEGRA